MSDMFMAIYRDFLDLGMTLPRGKTFAFYDSDDRFKLGMGPWDYILYTYTTKG